MSLPAEEPHPHRLALATTTIAITTAVIQLPHSVMSRSRSKPGITVSRDGSRSVRSSDLKEMTFCVPDAGPRSMAKISENPADQSAQSTVATFVRSSAVRSRAKR